MGLASYNSVAFFGPQGSGKTLAMLRLGLQLACERKRGLVSNLKLNPEKIYKYGEFYKKDWLKQIVDDRAVISLLGDKDVDLIFRYPYSIVMFDEAGILMNSRSWQNNSGHILREGNQLRKNRCTFLWTAQYEGMSDKVMRATVERCVWCAGKSFFNPEKQIDILVWQDVKFFEARQFWSWVDTPLAQLKPLKTYLKSCGSWWGPVSKHEKMLFDCYRSHDSIGSKANYPLQPIVLPSKYRSDLPKYYYYQRMPPIYMWKDPILLAEYEWVEPDSIPALAYEFEGGQRREFPFRKKLRELDYNEFEAGKLLPYFNGWDNYGQLLASQSQKKVGRGKGSTVALHPQVARFLN